MYYWGNCVGNILYLYFTGRVHSIAAINSTTKLWPVHYLALTKKGHVIHFETAQDDKHNTFGPFWYYGRVRGISKWKQEEALKKANRVIVYRFNDPRRVIYWLLFLYVSFFIPVYILWCLHPIYCFTKSLFKIMRRAAYGYAKRAAHKISNGFKYFFGKCFCYGKGDN